MNVENLTPGLGPRVEQLERQSEDTLGRLRKVEKELHVNSAKRGERDKNIFSQLEIMSKRINAIENKLNYAMYGLIALLLAVVGYLLRLMLTGAF